MTPAIGQPALDMGEVAAGLLVERLAKPDLPARHVAIPTTLLWRGSVRAG
jgi:DNA-binding LacI/PurR family transcriptional regulator